MSILKMFSKIFDKKSSDSKGFKFKNRFFKDRIEISIDGKNGRENLKNYLEKYSDTEVEYFKETLIFQIDFEKNVLILEYEDIYNLSINELEYFLLPGYFKGVIDIKNRGYILNQKGFQFEMSFSDLKKTYEYIDDNYYVTDTTTGEKYFLEKTQMGLVSKIIEFNKKNLIVSDPEEQLNLIETIQKVSENIFITYSEQLHEFHNLETIDRLQIDFEKIEGSEGKLEIVPRIEGFSDEENKELQKKFKQAKKINQFYELEIEGETVKIVFNKKLKQALQVIKEEPVISETDFIIKKSKIFNDERLEQEEIDIIYGPRVKGLGYLNYRSSAIPNNNEINWIKKDFPYIQTMTERVFLRPENIDTLKDAVKNTLEGNPIVIKIGDDKIIIPSVEDVENQIKQIENSIIDFPKIKKVKEIEELIEYFKEYPEEKYYAKNGFYIQNPKDIELLESYKESLNLEEIEKDKNRKKSLLLKDNLEKLDYEEEKKSILTKEFKFIKPSSLKKEINLFPHQEEGIAKLQNLYSIDEVNGVLLADDMGLGKTIQILIFLAWLKEKKGKKTNLKALLVMPTSLINNWNFESDNPKEEGEIQKFFNRGTFKVTSFKGKLSDERIDDLNYSDIIITSYESLRLNHIKMGKINWSVISCDESQKIKNPTTLVTTAIKTQNANFKIACSATPIENTSEDLWCLMDFVKPGLLGSLKDFKKEFSKPITNNQSKIEVIEKLNNNLKGKIDDFYIRRVKDVLNVDGSFPDKIICYYNTLPSKIQDIKFQEIIEESYDPGQILGIIQKMLMISSHPEIANGSDLISTDIEVLEKESSKINTLKKVLDKIKNKDEKAIIFTKYKKMQKIISILINTWYKLSPSIINGDVNTSKRKEALDKFKQNEGFDIIVLSPEAAGVGLNITEANHVIHYTRHWNPAKEEQATDRVYRIGQKKDVYVHYPILSYNENYPETVTYDLETWIEEELNRSLEISTPEEKLNYIIMKKKKMLKDFFLATPLDVDASDFLGVMGK